MKDKLASAADKAIARKLYLIHLNIHYDNAHAGWNLSKELMQLPVVELNTGMTQFSVAALPEIKKQLRKLCGGEEMTEIRKMSTISWTTLQQERSIDLIGYQLSIRLRVRNLLYQ